MDFALERGDKAQRAAAMGLVRAHRSCLKHTQETPHCHNLLPGSQSTGLVANEQPLCSCQRAAVEELLCLCPGPLQMQPPARLCRLPLSVWELEPSLGTSSRVWWSWALMPHTVLWVCHSVCSGSHSQRCQKPPTTPQPSGCPKSTPSWSSSASQEQYGDLQACFSREITATQ